MAEAVAIRDDGRREAAPLAFTVVGQAATPNGRRILAGLKRTLQARGHEYRSEADEGVGLVIHVVDGAKPRSYRRRSQAVFVLGVVEVDRVEPTSDVRGADVRGAVDGAKAAVLAAGYPLLIRSLSNLLLYIVDGDDGPATHFVTLEQGAYSMPTDVSEGRLLDALYERVAPLASSRLVINNVFRPDLPEALWDGDEYTEQLRRAGRRLEALDLLPAPFPIQELLSPDEWRHLQRLFSLGGLSYGNLSVRRDAQTFWMSGSGVDKSDMRTIGRDMLLVRDYDAARDAMLLSVPENVKPNRVSVDAIEHWMIYREHPAVGAIVHVHAWMDDIPSTQINYPCGTYELAHAVAEKVREAPDASRAVIGLRNHGLTITGTSLDDIFARIEGRIIPQVPMS